MPSKPTVGFRHDIGIYEILREYQARIADRNRYFSATFHGRIYRLVKHPLYIFREDWTVFHSLRCAAVWISEWRWFERFIMLLILMSCVVLALPASYDPGSAAQWERDSMYYINVVAMLVFSLESILKIIARGLIFSDAPDCCYLREKTNWLDLIAVISSQLEVFGFSPGTSEDSRGGGFMLVRAFRVIRATRTLKVFPDLRMLANTLSESGPLLVQWLFFIGLVFCVLAAAGMNLLGVVYWQRCRLTPAPIREGAGGLSWPLDPDQTGFFCGGRYSCAATSGGEPTYCGTVVDASNGVMDGIDPWPEIELNPGADYGYSGYHSFGASLITTLQVSTMDGWSNLLYRYQDGAGDIVSVAFFLTVLILGGLVLLNLAPAILWESFCSIHANENDASKYRRELHIPQEILTMRMPDLVQELTSRKQKLKKELVIEQVNDVTAIGFKPLCLWVCSRPAFENFFLFLILLNTITLAIDAYPPLDPVLIAVCDRINLSCSVLFALEVLTKLGGFGVYFFADHLNVADFVFVALSVLGSTSLSALRTIRLLRFLKLEIVVRRNVALRVLLRVLKKAVVPTYSYFVIAGLYCYCMALLGLQLFFPQNPDEFPTATTFPRFDSLIWAFTSAFSLFSGGDWYRGMVQHAMTQESSLVLAYHLTLIVISRVVLAGLVLGLFAACFSQAREELLIECRRELSMLRNKDSEIMKEEIDAARAAAKAEATAVDEDAEEPDSPMWPKDIIDSRPAPSKTSSPGMNVLRMMRIKQNAQNRARNEGRSATFGHHQVGRVGPHAARCAAHRTGGAIVHLASDAPARPLNKKKMMVEALHGAEPPTTSAPSPLPEAGRPRALEFRRPCIPLLNLDETTSTPLLKMDETATASYCGAAGLRQRLRRPPPCRAEPGLQCDFRELVQRAREDAREAGARRAAGVEEKVAEAEPASHFKELFQRAREAAKEVPRDPGKLDGASRSPGPVRDEPLEVARTWREARTSEEPGGRSEPVPRQPLGELARPQVWLQPAPLPRRPTAPAEGPDVEEPAGLDREERAETIQLREEGVHAMRPPGALARSTTKRMNQQDGQPQKHPPGKADLEENPTGRLRAQQIVTAPAFDPAILFLILISNVCLAFESPYQDPKGNVATLFHSVDVVVVLAFAVEMFLKMYAYGLWTAPLGYFTVGWNWVDFVTSITGIFDVIFKALSGEEASLKILRSLRVIRVLRPLRLIRKFRGTRILVEALITSLPTLGNVVIIVIGFYLGVAIVMVNLLKGQLWHCSLDPLGELRPEIETKQDCLTAGGQWVNAVSNFDHLGNSLVTLMQIGTGAGWVDTMLTIVNSVGEEKQPRPTTRPEMTMPVMLFVATSRLVLLSLFVGVMIDAYVFAKHELDGVELLSWDERRWVHMQRTIFFNPSVMILEERDLTQAPLRGKRFLAQRIKVKRVVESKYFKVVQCTAIIGCAASACVYHPTLPASQRPLAQVVNLIFSYMVSLEVGLKIFIYNVDYLKDGWNVYSLVVALCSDLSVLVDVVGIAGSMFARFIRVSRVMRVISIMKEVTFQRMLLVTVQTILPGLVSMMAILFLVLFMFACLGVGLFGTIAPGDNLGTNANFSGFVQAFLLLVRVATGERWHLLLYDVVSDKPGCVSHQQTPEELERDGPLGCGSLLGYPYFLSFALAVSIVLMNLIIAVVLDGFHDVFQDYSLKRYIGLAKDLARAWHQLDFPFTGFLELDEVVAMLMEIPQPVGFGGSGCSAKHVVHQMRYLRLYDGRKVHFSDIVTMSARRCWLWIKGDYERNVYFVELEAKCFKQWHDLFSEQTDFSTIHPLHMLKNMEKERNRTSGHVNRHKGKDKPKPKPPPPQKDAMVQEMERHQVATVAAAHKDIQLYVGHLIVAVSVTHLIKRKREEWRNGKNRKKRAGSSESLEKQEMRHQLQVTIFGAKALRNADWYGSSDAFCRCKIKGHETHYIQTGVITASDPNWNTTGDLHSYKEGEALEFTVYDDDGGVGNNDLLGTVVLPAKNFFPSGFEGTLVLQETGKEQVSTISVKVVVGPAEEYHPAAPVQLPNRKVRMSGDQGDPSEDGVGALGSGRVPGVPEEQPPLPPMPDLADESCVDGFMGETVVSAEAPIPNVVSSGPPEMPY